MDRVYDVCKTHLMPNYSTTEKVLMLAVPLYGASAIALSQAQPSKRAVELFNNCVNEETKGNPELRQELEKSGRGLVEQLTGQLDALQCYDEGSRRELQCELALAAGTLGGSLSIAAAKKLGKKGISAIERRLGRKMLGLADNFRDLRRAAALSDAQRISEASELLGRKLKAYEAKQILDAHKVGNGRAGAGYFNYTPEEIAEKARILEAFTPDERRLLMERGIVGQMQSGGEHLGRTFAVRDYTEEIMALWDEGSSYAVRCSSCGFSRIKVDDVARGHIAARHEMHNLATQNMNKALNEINQLMARTPKGSHISTEEVLRILDKHGVPYLDNGVTTMFPRGTDINKFFENLKNVELKEIGTGNTMRGATDYSAVVNGDTYVVRICTSKQPCSRGDGLPAAKEGEVISAYPSCGQGVRLIPKPRDIRNILDNKIQSGGNRVMLSDIFPERSCS